MSSVSPAAALFVYVEQGEQPDPQPVDHRPHEQDAGRGGEDPAHTSGGSQDGQSVPRAHGDELPVTQRLTQRGRNVRFASAAQLVPELKRTQKAARLGDKRAEYVEVRHSSVRRAVRRIELLACHEHLPLPHQ